jgi:hypothetical protein
MRWITAALLGACLASCGSAMGGAPSQPNQQGQYQNSQTAWGDDNQAPQGAWTQDPAQAPVEDPVQNPVQAGNQSQPPVQQQQQTPPPAPPPSPPSAQNQSRPDDRWNADNSHLGRCVNAAL